MNYIIVFVVGMFVGMLFSAMLSATDDGDNIDFEV